MVAHLSNCLALVLFANASHPHFTHHIRKKNQQKNPQNHPHFTCFKIRSPHIRILPTAYI